jgi:curved DNA-binding protein CbpA
VKDLYGRMGDLDHYSLLGVPRAADKKTIKRAYYELAGVYHPDKFFRKRLGSFKVMMEGVFARITQAHDVLTDKERRAEYDAYLGDVARTHDIEAMLKDALAEVQRAETAVRDAIPHQPVDIPAAPVPDPARPSAPAAAKPAASAASTASAATEARRNALARRLLGNRAPPPRLSQPEMPKIAPPARPPSPAAAPGAARSPSPGAAMEALRRRYEERVDHAKRFQAKKYADNGAAAMAQNDPIAAANAYKVAVTLTPDDAELKARHDEVAKIADAVLSESYERQAGYEEKSERWEDAAKSWSKVVEGRPTDARAHERAANAMTRASGDLHAAAGLARRAVDMEPDNARFKATLAQVYIAAGLTLNAKRELDLALQLAPHDGTIQALYKRLAK